MPVLLYPRRPQSRQPMLLNRSLPGQEFINSQRIAVASLFKAQVTERTTDKAAQKSARNPPGIEFWPAYSGRGGCRAPFLWDASQKSVGFGRGKPWLPVEQAHLPHAAVTQEADLDSVLNFYRKAIKIRQQSAALRGGSIEFLEATETLLVIRRKAGEEEVTCVYNFGEEAVALPEADQGKRILVTECTSETLLPFGFAWLR
jgi:glycosidase